MKIERANDLGVMLSSEDEAEKIQLLMAYPEGGSVLFWVHLSLGYVNRVGGQLPELLQYLTPQEAMSLAAGLERSAIAALKEGA